jgi:hypothetical protein
MNSEMPERDESGRFLAGNSGNGGRRRGSRNLLAAAFIEALHDDFNQNGISAIERVRKDKPDVYIRVVAAILPRELDVALNVNHSLSEEFERALTHADAMRVLRAAREAVGAEEPLVIEHESEQRDVECNDRE